MQYPSPLGPDPSLPQPTQPVQSQSSGSLPVFNVADFGAKGLDDDSDAVEAAVAACAAAGGGIIYSPLLAIIRRPLVSPSNTRWTGGGRGGFKARNGAAIVSGLINATDATNVLVRNIELDANVDNGGGNYAVMFERCTRSHAQRCYIHDTLSAGIYDNDGWWPYHYGNHLANCGRAGSTDNHAIMVGSTTARGAKGLRVNANSVDTAWRKGITFFVFAPGSVIGFDVDGNSVTGCGFFEAGGGLYITQAGANLQLGNIRGNQCWNNYTNILVQGLETGTIANNSCRDSFFDCNYNFFSLESVTVTGNVGVRSAQQNMRILASLDVIMNNNILRYANRRNTGPTAALNIINTIFSTFRHNVINDPDHVQRYAILEEGSSDNNKITENFARDGVDAVYQIGGVNTVCDFGDAHLH